MAEPFLLPATQTQFEYPIELVLYKNNQVVYHWEFANIPPTSIQYQEPQRVNVQQGLGSSYLGTPYVDRYNAAVPQVTIDWTTSTTPNAVPKSSQAQDGYQHFFHLITKIFRSYYVQGASDPGGEWTLHLYDYPHQQFLEVVPLTNTWTHTTPENLALSSTMTFAVVQDLQNPGNPPPALAQTVLVDQPVRWINQITPSTYQNIAALAYYLNPNGATPIQQALWEDSPYVQRWTAQDYAEWFNNPNLPAGLTTNYTTFLEQTAPPVFEPILQTPTIPYSVSYAQLSQVAQQAQAYATQIAQINPTPYWMSALSQSIADGMSMMTIAPQIFAI